MADIPAKCSRCGRTFPFRGFAGGGITIIGSTTNCPFCGGDADIADASIDRTGRVHLLRSAYDYLTQPDITRANLQAAADILSEARSRGTSPEKIAEKLNEQVPALSPIARLLVPKTAGDTYALLGFILALVIWLVQHFDDKAAHSPDIIINQIFNQTTVVAPSEARSTRGATSRPKATKKVPRTRPRPQRREDAAGSWPNARCGCGSGERRRSCSRCNQAK